MRLWETPIELINTRSTELCSIYIEYVLFQIYTTYTGIWIFMAHTLTLLTATDSLYYFL